MSERPDLEQRLTEGLQALAARATVSPDSLERIAAGDASGGRRSRVANARRRRSVMVGTRLAATVGLAASVALVIALVPSPKPRPEPQLLRVTSPPPSLAPVAWTADGRLYLATGNTVRTLSASGHSANPQWSADQHWLAYFDPLDDGVRIVAADGSEDHQVAGGVVRGAFSWSPTGDQLAVAPAEGGVLVVRPDTAGTVQLVPSAVPVASIAWSQDGHDLAFTTPSTSGSTDQVQVVSADGSAAPSVPVTVGAGNEIFLAGWWPDDQGLLFWVEPGGDQAAMDKGLWLDSVALTGGPVRPLAQTLVYHPWLSWSPDGTQLLVVSGTSSSPATDKQLTVCIPQQGSCTPLPQPPGTVALDPAWSPDGSEIAFVRAPDVGHPQSIQWSDWFARRQLWVESAAGADQRPVTGAPAGAALPAWSRDGSVIGVSTGDGIVAIPAAGGVPRTLASGLAGSNDGTSGPDVLGKQPWSASAVWEPGGGYSLAAVPAPTS